MSHAVSVPEPVDPGAPSIVTSWLRTVIPGAWAALITTLLTAWPWLAGVLEQIHVDLSSPAVATVVVALVLAGWYAAWRKIEPLLPTWAKRLVLGGSKAPSYAPVGPDGVSDISSLPSTAGSPGVQLSINSDPGTSAAGSIGTVTPSGPADDDPPRHAA